MFNPKLLIKRCLEAIKNDSKTCERFKNIQINPISNVSSHEMTYEILLDQNGKQNGQ